MYTIGVILATFAVCYWLAIAVMDTYGQLDIWRSPIFWVAYVLEAFGVFLIFWSLHLETIGGC